MLSYQHSYHAGCLADVHKHSLLLAVLCSLKNNPAKIHYIETHAGRGFYDLASKDALKTKEAEEGILSTLKNPKGLEVELCDFIKKLPEKSYPGSPFIAASTLRETDFVHLCEKHKGEAKHLRQNMADFKRIQIAQKDGYDFVRKLNLSRHDQKLIFIDPSYEVKEEYIEVIHFIKDMHQRWPEAAIMLWYPKLQQDLHAKMIKELQQVFPASYTEEQEWSSAENTTRMYGTGLWFLNIAKLA